MATKTDILAAMDDHPAVSEAMGYWYSTVIPAGLTKKTWNNTKQQTQMANQVQRMRADDILVATAFIKYVLAEANAELGTADSKFMREVEKQIHTDYFDLEYSGKDSRKNNPVHSAKWRLMMLLLDITDKHCSL